LSEEGGQGASSRACSDDEDVGFYDGAHIYSFVLTGASNWDGHEQILRKQ
jgi:hypothetical protein